ncbi:MAG: hypothetical protein BWX63_01805 [Bacteroidetes bacterium ADurb.Bin041]|nr:MAG: hypothetical protein BWX63_01805 [Bacteroidetes bacterium ADurb.Bin041]
MTPEQFKKRFANMQISLKTAINNDLPLVVGNEVARLFRINFQEEGFFGKKWIEVQRRQSRTIR